MENDSRAASSDDQEADQALRDARSRFVAGFTQRLGAMETLLEAGSAGNADSLTALREAAHKMAGLAGVLGFPSVSDHASALEGHLLLEPAINQAAAKLSLDCMGSGFTRDLSNTIPSWATDAAPAKGARILIVEDDQEQRRVAASGLRSAGYRVLTAESGPEAVEVAMAERPDLILLDVDLPGLDGMAVCRQLKLNPALAATPVIFCTARTGLMDRMAGLTLGADDYITKPFVPAELLIRIRLLLVREAREFATTATVAGVLTYDLFTANAREALARGPASLVLFRVGKAELDRLTERLSGDLRRRDALGRYGTTHLMLLTPGLSADAARAMTQGILDGIQPAIADVSLGVAESAAAPPGGSAATLEALMGQADLALAADRIAKSGSQRMGTAILLAEDDPDVLHILDARLKAAGYRTILTLDGQQTLDALEKETPAAIVLDLMMPKVTGFDLLMHLRGRASRPRTIVVSARGRDEDVARAFQLGADDYLTKPFNPEELVARLARLLR